jgi:hypothetical protein
MAVFGWRRARQDESTCTRLYSLWHPIRTPLTRKTNRLNIYPKPGDARHWSVTNLHKLSDQYRWALWNTHHIKLTFVTPTNKLSSFLLIFKLFSLIFYWKYSIFLHETPHTWNMTWHILDVIEEWRQRYGNGHLEIRKNDNKRHKYI